MVAGIYWGGGGGGGGNKSKIKSSENNQMTDHFQSFFFLISPEKNSKIYNMVDQSSVLNLYYFIIFLKIWTGYSLLTVSFSKIHIQNLKNILFFS